MAKKKYCAARVGKVPGIYHTCNTCKEYKAQVDGVGDALYKSFIH